MTPLAAVTAALALVLAADAGAAPRRRSSARAARVDEGRLVGTLEMPRLGISVPVREGTTEKTLVRAVGHIRGTALPDQPGNVGLAGHRTSHFEPLRDVKDGDEIRFVTSDGPYVYEVVSTEIVKPSVVRVLRSDGHAMLTLVTCWPFDWVGHAPNRFIVRAHLKEGPFLAGNGDASAAASDARPRSSDPDRPPDGAQR